MHQTSNSTSTVLIKNWITKNNKSLTSVFLNFACADLFTLAVEVNEGVTGWRDVLRRHSLVHAIDVEMETTVGVHQQTQHRPLGTSVQVRTIVLTYLRRIGKEKENSWLNRNKKKSQEKESSEDLGGKSKNDWKENKKRVTYL